MNSETQQSIHPGYMADAKGRLVPEDMVKPIDRQRHDIVSEVVEKAIALQKQMKEFKTESLDDIQAFVELSAEEYGAQLGGIKGNVSLTTYDGQYKLQRSIAEYITFDERLQIAKELIDKCIHRWSDGARPEIRVLVQDAFQTDRQGKINTGRVLGLQRLDIQDEEWKQAMKAITDSIQVAGSRTYVRLYRRIGQSDQWAPISLDIAAL